MRWEPVQGIVDALDAAFYTSFGNVEPTGRRVLLAVDVSGSMRGTRVNGLPGLPASTAAAAMALVTAATEPNHAIEAFDTERKELRISPSMRLAEAKAVLDKLIHGGTDCAIPISHATHSRTAVDAFVVLTDSETWQGSVHPAQAMQAYRGAMNRPAKLAVVAMCSNRSTIADPGDPGTMNFAGFDTAVPELLRQFIAA